MAKEEQITAVSKRVRNPEITLTQKVLDGIKSLKIDDVVTLTLKAKVMEIGKESDYDFDIPIDSDKIRPKILKARFEITSATKKQGAN